MTVKPFGMFAGRKSIQGFWENSISQGYSNVSYIEPDIEKINTNSAIISSKWKMNKAHGIITKELWILQGDGQEKLRIEILKCLGARKIDAKDVLINSLLVNPNSHSI